MPDAPPAADDHPVLWLGDRLVPVDEAAVSPFDHGVTVGDGVFETCRILDDAGGTAHAFALTRHLRRLRRSADGLGLTLPWTDADLREAVRAVLDANHLHQGRLRITVTGGLGPLGSDRGPVPPTLIVAASPFTPFAPASSVLVVPWRRNEHSAVAGLKTTSYAENVVALERAHAAGADEAIFANTAGRLCEGTGSNVFVGLGGRLRTPPLASGCLAGVTRALVMELVEVVEEDLPLEALAGADEAFLTSSGRDVQPIATVDGRPLPTCPGPLSQAAAAALAACMADDVDP